jgi:hypothetical protein
MELIHHKVDVVEVKNFLTKQECDALIDYYESSSNSWQLTCFYNARVMDPFEPWRNESLPGSEIDERFLRELRIKFQDLAENVFKKDLKNLSLSAHKWLPGAFADFHSDNSELDGTPNAWQENKLVTILYLNDNYEGGHLVFKDHPIDIAPEAGTVVVFDVGYENIHGVTEILSGQRWTMLASFDYADSVYPPEYWEQKNKELAETAEIHREQREGWEKGKIDRLIGLQGEL